jgi:hypothetical protein
MSVDIDCQSTGLAGRGPAAGKWQGLTGRRGLAEGDWQEGTGSGGLAGRALAEGDWQEGD